MTRDAGGSAEAEALFWWRRVVRPGVPLSVTQAGAGNLAFHVGSDDDAVGRSRARLAATAGVPAFRYMSQVHGSHAVWADDAGPAPTADALLSRGEPLAVMVADCVPVMLAGTFADGSPAFAAVHAGRPGLAAGIVREAVDALHEAGASGLEAWLGPSICGRCYEVPAELREEVDAAVPGTATTTSWGTPALDLPAGVLGQLAAAGVPAHTDAVACTFEQQSLYSHRREPGRGRFAGLVWSHA